jgi:putative integral membrane protein (TIGR02587 family)
MARPRAEKVGLSGGTLQRLRTDDAADRSVAQTARQHLTAIAGGLLVGLPLLWTMEVWDDGAVLSSGKILVLLAIGFAVVVGFNALAGFRRDRTWLELLVDSVEAMGMSVAVAAVALAVLGRLDPALGLPTLVGRIAIETIPVAFGMSLASTVMGRPGDDKGGPGDGKLTVGPLGRLIVAGAGALYFALNIAPTDEVRMLAAESSPVQLLMAVVAGLGIGLAIVFYSDFRGGLGQDPQDRRWPLETPLGETVAAYALALLTSLVLLWAFGSTDGANPHAVLAQVVMLAIVASFGAAGSRLIVGVGGAGGQRGAETG